MRHQHRLSLVPSFARGEDPRRSPWGKPVRIDSLIDHQEYGTHEPLYLAARDACIAAIGSQTRDDGSGVQMRAEARIGAIEARAFHRTTIRVEPGKWWA